MSTDSDGIEEALEGQLRILLTATGQAVEQIARQREKRAREAATASQQQARELQARFEAEQRSARALVSGVYRSGWWNQANPEQIANTYQVASAWADVDRDAQLAQARMREEIKTRYGMDPEELQKSAQSGPAPVYSVTSGQEPQELNRKQAMELVDSLPADAKLVPDGKAPLNDVQSWINRDYELDQKIHAKFPEIFAKDQAEAFEAQTKNLARVNQAQSDKPQGFVMHDFDHGRDSTITLTKDHALRMIEGTPKDAQRDPSMGGRDGISYFPRWIGIDHEVDQKLHDKFPHLFSDEQSAAFLAESERRKASQEAEEAALLVKQANEQDRDAEAAREAAEFEPDPDDRIRAANDAEKHEALADKTREESKDVYDSSERREKTADELQKNGIPKDAIDARMAADVSNAKPATEAIKNTSKVAKSPKARRGNVQQKSRSEMSR